MGSAKRKYKKCKYIGKSLIDVDNATPKSGDKIGIAEDAFQMSSNLRRNRKISLQTKNSELLCNISPGSASWTSVLRQQKCYSTQR